MTTRREHLAAMAAAASGAEETWDVVVYSGVPCGIAAAIAAAREGARVLLLEPTKHVGGLSTSGINTAESEHMLHWTFGGIALEFYKRMGDHYGTGKPEFYFESSVAEKTYLAMLREAKVMVRYGARVEKVRKAKGAIETITLSDGSTLRSKVWVDASYEGDLMARSGVQFTFGRESRSEYNEEAAGVRFDKTPREARSVDANGKLLPGISAWTRDLREGDAHRGVMNYNFRLTFAKDPKYRVEIPKPQSYDAKRYALLGNWLKSVGDQAKLVQILDFYARRNGKFEVNNKQAAVISIGHFGGQFDYPDASYDKREEIVADHWNYTLGLIHFLRTEDRVPAALRAEMAAWGLHREEFTDNGNLPYQLYIREARRMRGMAVVTQKDVTTDRRKSDSIGISSHFIDSHHVQRVAVSDNSFVNEGRIWRLGWAYQIPYAALIPKADQCTNLIVPGAASYTHVGFCTYRLESVWMIGGHAAGVAAAMAAQKKLPVAKVDLSKLQAKLRAQKQVIDFVSGAPEKWSDPKGGTGGPPEF